MTKCKGTSNFTRLNVFLSKKSPSRTSVQPQFLKALRNVKRRTATQNGEGKERSNHFLPSLSLLSFPCPTVERKKMSVLHQRTDCLRRHGSKTLLVTASKNAGSIWGKQITGDINFWGLLTI